MNTMLKNEIKEEDPLKVEKSTVMQETKIFNQTPLNPKKCLSILTKILVCISRGDSLSRKEATDAFFAMTKLFQNSNVSLRRMVYIVIKELSTIADDVIIVTSCLTKDLTGNETAFRGAALRALCKILEPSMLQSVERYLKQAIVDKHPNIASSVLASAYHLCVSGVGDSIVKKWPNEIQEAANNSDSMVKYHAYGLLYHIRKNDKLSVNKLVQRYIKSGTRSPLATCFIIRVVAKIINEEGLTICKDLFDFLESCLRSKKEVVVYEAARAIVSIEGISLKELSYAVSVLQLLSSSLRSINRYAAVRTLNLVANKHPLAVMACDLDLERLFNDSNKSVATLAITTLLKTGSESNLERLLKKIFSFISDLTDEFKMIILESIRMLAAKYPKKYSVLFNFLACILRESSSYSFKKAVILTCEIIIRDIPESRNLGLSILCEFIEDCEHVKLTERILHLIGQEGPYLNNPRQFTRYIYNRVMLETAPVKCTATTALARFGAVNEELLPSILVILKRIMLDEDNEVRDRAAFYHFLLNNPDKSLRKAYILGEECQYSMSALERSLLSYAREGCHAQPFSLDDVPLDTSKPDELPKLNENITKPSDKGKANTQNSSTNNPAAFQKSQAKIAEDTADEYARQFSEISELAKLGPIFKSSKHVELTEVETEYVVTCVKHVLKNHLVVQYNIKNTMMDQCLHNVQVDLDCENPAFNIIGNIPIFKLGYNENGIAYTIIELPGVEETTPETFGANMTFLNKSAETGDDDPGYEDEYPIEAVTFDVSDSMQKIAKMNFTKLWEEYKFEETEVYQFDIFKSIQDTVQNLIEVTGMSPCERSDILTDSLASSHILKLSGVFRGGTDVLVRAKIIKTPNTDPLEIIVEFNVRSKQQSPVPRIILDSFES